MGTAFSGLHFHEQEYEVWRTRGHEAMSSYASIGIYTGSCSGQISIHLGLNAPSFTIATGCECSTAAIAQAAELIIANEADVMFAGGADAPIRPAIMSAFSITHALATRNDEPARASRPFDRKRNGFVMGEGGCVLVLEELERARRRGATIYAEITGSANTCDAHHMCHPHPTGEQAARCMEMAMTRAGINPSDVDYLSAHGSSTPLGDSTETLVLKTVLGQQAYNIPLSSIKSTVGHTQGACGALEVAASCMALRHNIIPPTINRDYPDPECDLDCVPHRPRHRLLNTIVKNSFGFGGRNTVLVLERVAPAESALFVPVTPIQTEAYCQ
jgi:3-oxoacyl-[acyl-carrier-protein] synthase II